MCGRTACTLEPGELRRACTYMNRRRCRQQPQWRDDPCGRSYYPSYNIPPTAMLPVLFSGKQRQSCSRSPSVSPERKSKRSKPSSSRSPKSESCSSSHGKSRSRSRSPLKDNEDTRVIQPMRWGFIPFYYRGSLKDFHFTTSNARSDRLMESKFYSQALRRGNRCVVVCDGFYEWKRTGSEKTPYFIYSSQEPNTDIKTVFLKQEDVKLMEKMEVKQEFDEMKPGTSEWDGRRLLMMAGIYDTWRSPDNPEEPMHTFSVITVDAASDIQWMHDRMPAILETEKEISDWLDAKNVPFDEAIKLLRPRKGLQLHRVSTVVNNVRNKEPQCVVPYDEKAAVKTSSKESKLMSMWLKKGKSPK